MNMFNHMFNFKKLNSKIIQIAIDNKRIYALTDDGSIYYRAFDDIGWHELENNHIVSFKTDPK